MKFFISQVNSNSVIYNDTYSLFSRPAGSINPLPEEFIGTRIGQLKLVKKVKKNILPGRLKLEVYLTLDENNQSQTTLAGVNYNLTSEICESLLNFESQPRVARSKRRKWIRNYALGKIEVINTSFFQRPAREWGRPVRKIGKWIGTTPVHKNN